MAERLMDRRALKRVWPMEKITAQLVEMPDNNVVAPIGTRSCGRDACMAR